MVEVPAGEFLMGSDSHCPEEAPAHPAEVDSFWIDIHPVTNSQFADFVERTAYVTVAERALDAADYPGVPSERLVSGSAVFVQPRGPVDLNDARQWWAYVPGACWRRPEGPESSLDGRLDHPVTHVAFEDAAAFASWAGKSLPSEVEWERAARGLIIGADFCWGNQLTPRGTAMANIWDGEFPWESRKRLRPGTTSVMSYPPNEFGLFDMAGNVWEWTRDHYRARHAGGERHRSCCAPRDQAQVSTPLADPASPGIPLLVIKGGSFLCAPNYCARYRPAARIGYGADSSACHIAFRCVAHGRHPAAPRTEGSM